MCLEGQTKPCREGCSGRGGRRQKRTEWQAEADAHLEPEGRAADGARGTRGRGHEGGGPAHPHHLHHACPMHNRAINGGGGGDAARPPCYSFPRLAPVHSLQAAGSHGGSSRWTDTLHRSSPSQTQRMRPRPRFTDTEAPSSSPLHLTPHPVPGRGLLSHLVPSP